MKIHEYQAKQIFANYQIPVTKEVLCESEEEVARAAEVLGLPVVVKAQVLTGGRGKAGGVRLAKTRDDALSAARKILGMRIKGSVMLMASREGGVEIEEVAKTNPDAIIKYAINAEVGFRPFKARKIAFQLFDNIELVREGSVLLTNLYRAFIETDASLVEINPLVITGENKLCALDGKMNFDDNALFRQPNISEMREVSEEEKVEIDAKEKGLSFIKLDGSIGCIVNGAGLAMATMDMIKIYGGHPANFLDIGGSSNPQKVVDAVNLILSDKKVKILMINIFGGITRCDDVAKGLLTALKQIDVRIPIVVRLSGTNAEEGLKILQDSNLITVERMSDAAEKAVELSGGSRLKLKLK
jgi:succinyl-CoA synthetase beta subunit